MQIQQSPEPGSFRLFYRGDLLRLDLRLPGETAGKAFLRTNIGRATVRRREIVRFAEEDNPILGRDWHDVPMVKSSVSMYSVVLPLLEVGCFEAKAFFLPSDKSTPVWPGGSNTRIKVEPAEYCCGNTMYSAFVRQFGPWRSRYAALAEHERAVRMLDDIGYTVIPRSGTFRDMIHSLDFIIREMGFGIIQLLPIHPVPTTYARMGRFGSPFAALDFMDVDPALAEFDRKTTPLDQFRELADAIHCRSGKLFLDIPVNHTGWASHLQLRHPEWFAYNPDESFRSPGAWGVVWSDLSQLDYKHHELWKYMADVFLFWCGHGADGFRCDAGYMVPYDAWEYITARVRQEYPDTIFLLEGLGGKVETVEHLLSGADLNWAYSELFQNYDRGQVEWYLPDCNRISVEKGALVHFAETHDNDRLAAKSKTYARMRTTLSALFSHNGAFGITSGVEWFCDRKIDVHEARPLYWGNEENMIDHLARLNAILRSHPCFHPGTTVRLIQVGDGNVALLSRTRHDPDAALLAAANLDDRNEATASWRSEDFPVAGDRMYDLILGREIRVTSSGGISAVKLGPGEVLCMARSKDDFALAEKPSASVCGFSPRSARQHLQTKALEIITCHRGLGDCSDIEADAVAGRLAADPRAFCAETAAAAGKPALIVAWEWPRDTRRTVMVPPEHMILAESDLPFTAEIRDGARVLQREQSLPRDDGRFFAIFIPMETVVQPCERSFSIAVYKGDECRRVESPLLFLARRENAPVRIRASRNDVRKTDCYGLCTNKRGAMSQVRGAWGEIRSQYDAILAANLHPDFPVDRQALLTRCRCWVVNLGYSLPLDINCLDHFAQDRNGTLSWQFSAPVGQGKKITLVVTLRMIEHRNTVVLSLHRLKALEKQDDLDDATPVKIIIRPDIEDRANHWKTKAFMGAESTYARSTESRKNGFVFSPTGIHRLAVQIAPGTFVWEPEWQYMVGHPVDGARGFDGSSDLFSPGYFTMELAGGQSAALSADILSQNQDNIYSPDAEDVALHVHANDVPLDEAMLTAIRHFIVKRDESLTVIAGYPWFLDWGRDTLICLRGIIAAGMLEESEQILMQFARFESKGTLPNMLRGNDASNRDTSDAPLWFCVACRDLARAGERKNFLKADVGGRTVMDVIRSIAEGYEHGTPNGIRMDRESGLIFSPSHFSWMDTNFPAGTPREGYPIEIQALWYATLAFLAELEPEGKWQSMKDLVKQSIRRLYIQEGRDFLSDCLHASPGVPAGKAHADDALRPNQLLVITLGDILDNKEAVRVIAACEELLVPGAIRSLGDRAVKHRLPVFHNGHLLNDPAKPYWGRYDGDEDTRRKPAYHNGTAWTWLFPSYCEALAHIHGPCMKETALSILSSSAHLINRGCIGQVPELADGDTPHPPKGCGAQAWGVTELYRVLALLAGKQ